MEAGVRAMSRPATTLLVAVWLSVSVGDAKADAPTADACATASDNAQPLRKAGHLGAAKRQLLVCVNKSCPAMVRDDCVSQLSEIEKAMPTVVFAAMDAEDRDLSAVQVRMDGEPLVDHLDGTSVPVDPGEHTFQFEVAGSVVVSRTVVLREGERDRRVVVSFTAPQRTTVPSARHGEPEAESATSPTLWPAYVAVGVGVLGLAAGVIFTVSAINQNSTLAGECTLPNSGCDPRYQPQLDILHKDQVLAGIGYGVAAVGAGLGTYLFVTSGSSSPKAQSRAPSMLVPRIGLGWLGVGGQFQ
jgi:hypothetical protein